MKTAPRYQRRSFERNPTQSDQAPVKGKRFVRVLQFEQCCWPNFDFRMIKIEG